MRTLLALLSLALAPSLRAEDVAIPPDAGQVLAENGWQILLKEEIFPGTEKFRAQSFTRTYYCGKLGAGKARIVFEEQGTGTHLQPLRIAPDGTMVASVYSNKLLFVGPDDLPGKVGDGTAVVLPDQKPKAETAILHASAAGLVVHPAELNKPVPVYFVPLDGNKPLVEKAVELCIREAHSLHRTRTGFHVSDKWIVWESGSYEVATGKIRRRVADAESTDRGIDGDLILTERSATVDKKVVHELVSIDLKTGAPQVRQPIARDAWILMMYDGVAYVLTPLPFKGGAGDRPAEVVAHDIAKSVEPLSKQNVAMPPSDYSGTRVTPKGFRLRGFTVEWVKK